MTGLNIEIVSKNDKLPGQKGQIIMLRKMVIYERSTESGRTGVVLEFEGVDGTIYHALTTARMIANGMAGAIRGAAERFGDNLQEP